MWIPLKKYVKENFDTITEFMASHKLGAYTRYYKIVDKPAFINSETGRIFRAPRRVESKNFSSIRYSDSMGLNYITFDEYMSKHKMTINEFVSHFGITYRSRFYSLKGAGCKINEEEQAIYLPPAEIKPRVPQKRRKKQ
ncbi:TPA: hypothetical protein NJ810_004429 [Vibrio parahaemolyticus]|nr:hypothetical protein [Vibrio parahaemolyticus]